jgi:hypothetical protein
MGRIPLFTVRLQKFPQSGLQHPPGQPARPDGKGDRLLGDLFL